MVRKRTVGTIPFCKHGEERVLFMLLVGSASNPILRLGLLQNLRYLWVGESHHESIFITYFLLLAVHSEKSRLIVRTRSVEVLELGLIQGPNYPIGSAI